MNSRATRVETFEVCVPTLVALRINCIRIGGHVEQPSGPTVHSLYCGSTAIEMAHEMSILRVCVSIYIIISYYLYVRTWCLVVVCQ